MNGTTNTSKLLADPAQVAAVRNLINYARKADAQHLTYFTFTGGPLEHVWKVSPARVCIFDGFLFYERHGELILKVRVTDPRQVGQLLAAIGVLPQRFAGGAR